jgi:hypothetical protein
MNNVSIIFAKLAGIKRNVSEELATTTRYFDLSVLDYFKRYEIILQQLKQVMPELYADLPPLDIPQPTKDRDYNVEYEYISRYQLENLSRDLTYIFEVRANCGDGEEVKERPERIFISHGRSHEWYKVQAYVERDIKLPTLELAQEANLGRTVFQKLIEESDKCRYAVIVMTGDDELGDQKRARENVMHEIGFFQGKYGAHNVCLLYEEGTSIPTNIHGLVYSPFTKGMVDAAFALMRREIEAAFKK